MDYPVIDVTATGRNIGTMIRRSNYSARRGGLFRDYTVAGIPIHSW